VKGGKGEIKAQKENHVRKKDPRNRGKQWLETKVQMGSRGKGMVGIIKVFFLVTQGMVISCM
jgi:hypothetical protein